MQSFQAKRRVEFADTDMAGIVHFSSFFRYMEETEYAFLRSLGLSVVIQDEMGIMGMPRREAKCQYHRPARFEEVLTIDLQVAHNDGLRMKHKFRITHQELLIAEGELMVVCCRFPKDRAPYAIPFPDQIIEHIPLNITRAEEDDTASS
ncbi:MAG: thioesterase family protein [Pirellulaceae bacterium]